jgi:hypothetical protein
MTLTTDPHTLLRIAIVAAGAAQITIGLASLAIPKILRWGDELSRVGALTRQVFWVYAGYILMSNVAFGAVSILASAELLDGSILAAGVTGFIALWWIARLGIQFFYFDKSQMPSGFRYTVMCAGLVAAIVFLSLTYGTAFAANCIMNL